MREQLLHRIRNEMTVLRLILGMKIDLVKEILYNMGKKDCISATSKEKQQFYVYV